MSTKKSRKCVICNVGSENSIFLIKFPRDPKLCRFWVKAIGQEDLLNLPSENLYDSYYVCDKHFSSKNFNRIANRLKIDTVPSLQLPLPVQLDDMINPHYESHIKTSSDKKRSKMSNIDTSRENLNKCGVKKETVIDPLETSAATNNHNNSYLKICGICLSDDVKIFPIAKSNLKVYYEQILSDKANYKILPQYLCYNCAALLKKYNDFREKCRRGLQGFHDFLNIDSCSTVTDLSTLTEKYNLLPTLQCSITVGEDIQIIYEEESVKSLTADALDTETLEDLDPSLYYIICDDNNVIEEEIQDTVRDDEQYTDEAILVNEEVKYADSIDVAKEELVDTAEDGVTGDVKFLYTKPKYDFDVTKWDTVVLSEEEAYREFYSRTESEAYRNSLYNCTLCLKGFSNMDVMIRHLPLHCEDRGSRECPVCKKRFDCETKLNSHMKVHYVRYHCLRCPKVCVTSSQAKVHEQFHSGVLYNCRMCEAKFDKMTTYYSHLRLKHRSEFVCAACGGAFVSAAGLRKHRRRAHPPRPPPQDNGDSDDGKINCDRCDMTFDNLDAYENHKRRSAKHAENSNTDSNAEEDLITINTTLTNNQEEPSVCKQCWKMFTCERSRRRHEWRVHGAGRRRGGGAGAGGGGGAAGGGGGAAGGGGGAAQERYICEICGASVLRSCLWQHRNGHTRARQFPCATCGRVFKTAANRHRHLVTHTGEKPFACELCDKRFTQRTNLKLHHRTYHLQLPYPPRNPRPKKSVKKETKQ